MGWRFVLCLSALCLPISLPLPGNAAENTDDDASSYTTDEVVISATRTPVPVGHSAAAVTVLTQQDIQRSPYPGGHQLDDLLRSVPGVQPATLSSRYNHPTAGLEGGSTGA